MTRVTQRTSDSGYTLTNGEQQSVLYRREVDPTGRWGFAAWAERNAPTSRHPQGWPN